MRSDGAFHLTDFGSWRGCDKRYELEVLGRVPPETRSPKALAGTAVHRVLDDVHARKLWDATASDLGEMWYAAFDWAVENPMRPEERDVPIWWGEEGETRTKADLCGRAMPMMAGYVADPRNREAFVLATHVRWRCRFAGVPWEGEIDRVDVNEDGTATVVDLKSGKERLTGPALALWTQLAYAVALRDAEFLHVGDDGERFWKPLNLVVRKVVWLHLRDYEPYKAIPKARREAGYVPGTPRGPAYYEVEVNPLAFAAMEREMRLFVEAVARGEFPRRPSQYECSRCRVQERCLLGYRGEIDRGSLLLTEEAYDAEG